ncbi:MAG TPA: MarR family transcriptional regulator [Candidatus Saccharimonadales bacterium]|nr:MarR family transcriptional regulator [Candidatus Saccharimonadales bacterium]
MKKNYTNNLGYWVKQFARLANRAVDAELKPYGIGRTQWYILHHTYHAEQLSQRSLQSLLQVESATLTPLISGLVRKGLISQQADPRDKRGKIVVLSKEGLALWQTLPDPIEIAKARALEGIPQADIEKARVVLEQAVHNLEKEE